MAGRQGEGQLSLRREAWLDETRSSGLARILVIDLPSTICHCTAVFSVCPAMVEACEQSGERGARRMRSVNFLSLLRARLSR